MTLRYSVAIIGIKVKEFQGSPPPFKDFNPIGFSGVMVGVVKEMRKHGGGEG